MDKEIKSIKTILIALGGILVFSNSMGLLVHSMMFTSTEIKPTSGIDLLFANFGLICLTAVIIGLLCIIGGILFNPRTKWTRKLVIFTSSLSIICIIGFSIILVNASVKEGIGIMLSFGFLIAGLVFSMPFVMLVIRLNRNEIIKHFT